MNHIPGSSQPVKKEENTFISPLTLYLEKNKMNMDHQVGVFVKTHVLQMILTSIFVSRLNVQALEPESLDSNPDLSTVCDLGQ